jgi:transcription elongation GreA/GreB family factor
MQHIQVVVALALLVDTLLLEDTSQELEQRLAQKVDDLVLRNKLVAVEEVHHTQVVEDNLVVGLGSQVELDNLVRKVHNFVVVGSLVEVDNLVVEEDILLLPVVDNLVVVVDNRCT